LHVVVIPSWYPSDENPIRGIFFRQQAHALERAGHRVGVVAPQHRSLRMLKRKRLGWPRGVSIEDDSGVSVYQHQEWALFPRIPHANLRLWLRAGEVLFERYVRERDKPDVVHAHSILNAGLLAARLKERFGVPAVLTEHSSAFARGMIHGWQERGVRLAFAAMDARLVVSPALGNMLEERYGAAVRPWAWVPNMVDTEFFGLSPSQERHSRQFTFLTVSFLSETKGHRVLLEAFARRFAGDSDVRLRIGGEGEIRGELERQAHELRISEQVNFLGPLDVGRVRDEMWACDGFVLSSFYETFGVVVIEALACGKPVIATRCGGPESVINARNGILVPVEDVAALGDAMERIKEQVSLYDPQGIRKDCVARFGEAAVAGTLTNVYENVVRERGAR
jgi:teichuronic acid biosynthesis glycosyltransferase TuaC